MSGDEHGSGDEHSRMMRIGDVAERTSLSLRTIRHYDDVGLLPPSARSEGGFRLYSEADVERLHHIRRIAPLGFSLEEIADILRILYGEKSEVPAEDYIDRAIHARDKMARKVRQADELLEDLRRRENA